MATIKERLMEFKEKMKDYKPITSWDMIEENGIYHIPPVISLERRDIIIVKKNDDTITFKRIDNDVNKEVTMARTSVYAKLLTKRHKF